MGNVLCLIITNIFISAGVIFFGITGKPLGLLIGAVIAMLATLPFLLSLPKQAPVLKLPTAFSYKRMLRIVVSDKRLLLFLCAMMLLYDTILTFQIYISSYMKVVFNFSDSLVLYAGITGLTFGIIGAASGGFLVQKISSPTKVLLYSALVYMFCACLFSIASPSLPKVFALLAFSGLSYGLVFSLGRAVYAEIIPIHSQHEYFGFFTVFERMAAVIGPLVWTGTFLLMTDFGKVIQYRVSVFGLAIVAFCAFMLLVRFHIKFGIFR